MEEQKYATTLAELEIGAVKPGDSKIPHYKIPDWYDEARFKRGQNFFRRHVFGISLSMHWSVVAGFSVGNILDAVVFTNGSNTPVKALNRYMVTFYHVFMWLTYDLFDETSKGYQSMKIVRGMHGNVAKRMNDARSDKVYVSQYDMAQVQAGFFGAVVVHPGQFGVWCTESELADYVYVWRVIGYCLGIEDRYNLCTGSLEETKSLVKELEQKCLIPALLDPAEDCDKMADAYIAGFNLGLWINLHSRKSVMALIQLGLETKWPYGMELSDLPKYWLLQLVIFMMYYVPGAKEIINYLTITYFVQGIGTVMKKRLKREQTQYS